MAKDYMFSARYDETHHQKIEDLLKQTGFTRTQLFLKLIDSVELVSKPVISASLPMNSNTQTAGTERAR